MDPGSDGRACLAAQRTSRQHRPLGLRREHLRAPATHARLLREPDREGDLCGIFAFSPPRFFRIGQFHLGPVQWVPFGLVFLHAYLDTGRRRDLRLAIAFFTRQALTSGHGAVFLAVAMAALVAYRLALGALDFAPQRALSRIGRLTSDVGAPGLLLLLPAVASYVPYRLVQVEMGLRHGLENWSIAPVSFLASPSHLQKTVLEFLSQET